jgi:hypothetical protein
MLICARYGHILAPLHDHWLMQRSRAAGRTTGLG